MSHFITVNRISQEEAEQYLEAIRQQQQRLNQRHWTVNYGDYNCYMPALASQQQRKSYVRLNRPAYRHSLRPQQEPSADSFADELVAD
jgi:hypothetical protein